MDPFTLIALAALYCGKGVASEIKKSFSGGNSSSSGSSSSPQSTCTTPSLSKCNTSASHTETEIKRKVDNYACQSGINLSNKNKTK